jgi:hypothetical protein
MSQDLVHDANEIHLLGPCPVCGNGSTPFLPRADAARLIYATEVGMDQPDDEAIVRVLNIAISVRLWARTLDLALQGCLVPVEIREGDDVRWQPIEQRLGHEEIAQYRLQFGDVSGEPSDPTSDHLLTSAERQRLTLAIYAGLGDGPGTLEQREAVIHWAEMVRRSVHDLDGILAGRLLPHVLADGEERFCVGRVDDLPAQRRAGYRHGIAQLETFCGQWRCSEGLSAQKKEDPMAREIPPDLLEGIPPEGTADWD